jgi:outer membrane protein assembly factor BamB
MALTRSLAFALSILVFTRGVSAQWPQFRGPSGQGTSHAKGLPLKWGESENVAWKTPIHGRAWSSPVVLDGQIWLTTATEDGKELSAICVDAITGRIVHDLKLFHVAEPQFAHKFNSYGSPTPVLEPGRAYVTFGSPGTACLDAKTGRKIWERTDFVCNHFRGAGSSPVIFGDLLMMNFDGSDYQYDVALDKNTGRSVWKTDRSIDFKDIGSDGKPEADGDWRKAFSTPRVILHDGRPVLVSLGSKALYGYDPQTGKELWRVENRACHSGSVTPLYGHGLVFACMGLAKGELWAIKPDGAGHVSDTHVAWKVKRGVPNKPSPVLVGDSIYMMDDTGVMSCLDAKSGEEVWRQRTGGNYSASPVYADGRIYFVSEEGKCTVVAASRQFKLLAENQLDDGFMSSPAVVDGALILRTRTHLYRVAGKD